MTFHWRKCVSNYRLWNGGHFIQNQWLLVYWRIHASHGLNDVYIVNEIFQIVENCRAVNHYHRAQTSVIYVNVLEVKFSINGLGELRVTLYTTGHLHTAVPHCSHSRAPIVHTAVPRENNEHGCVYLRCRAVCKLPGCVEGHPCNWPTNKHIQRQHLHILSFAFYRFWGGAL